MLKLLSSPWLYFFISDGKNKPPSGAKPLKTANTPSQIAEKITLQQNEEQLEFKLYFSKGREETFENKEAYLTRYSAVLLGIFESSLDRSTKIDRLQAFENRNINDIHKIDLEVAEELIGKNKNYINQIVGEDNGENTINT